MDLGQVSATWSQWTLNGDELHAPGWRQGLKPGHILALPYLLDLQNEFRKLRNARDAEVELLRRQVRMQSYRARMWQEKARRLERLCKIAIL